MLEGAWGTLAIVGVIVLGAAIAFAMFRNKDDTPRDLARSDRGSHDLYESESRKEIAEEHRDGTAGPDPRLD